MTEAGPHRQEANRSRSLLNRAVGMAANAAEYHPYAWKLAWEMAHRLPFLLPHDGSYRALRHFVVLRPEGLFLDVGANDGISALSFRKFSRRHSILSLEPNPLLEPALKNIKARDPLFDYRLVGAGAAPQRLRIFVPLYGRVLLHTFASTSRERVVETVAKSFGSSIAGAIEIKSFDCDIIAGDDLGVSPAIIKIDAEGYDYAVLQGLAATIGRSRPFIITEIDGADYQRIGEFFSAMKYVLLVYDLFADSFGPAPAAWDANVATTSGNRNFFAVPEETQSSLPVNDRP